LPPEATVGLVGLNDTEDRVIGVVVTVITVDASFVTPLYVALTKIPTVPALLPAMNDIDAPLPLSVPIPLLVRDHEYAMPEGQVTLHVGVAVKG
jgi:hypothetical protein